MVATRRINAKLPAKTVEALKKLAEERGVTVTELLRQSIGLESWLHKIRQENGRVYVERDGKFSEVLFR